MVVHLQAICGGEALEQARARPARSARAAQAAEARGAGRELPRQTAAVPARLGSHRERRPGDPAGDPAFVRRAVPSRRIQSAGRPPLFREYGSVRTAKEWQRGGGDGWWPLRRKPAFLPMVIMLERRGKREKKAESW